MSEEKPKPWKKTEDIPRRFDELPPELEWVPVSDVIRTQREDEAKEEAKKFKIKPPVDSDSDSDTDSNTEANEGDGNRSKEWETPEQKENEDEKYTASKNKIDATSMPPTVDDVTKSMLKWALNTEHYPKKVPKPQAHHQPHIKPLMNKPKPSHLVHDKSEKPVGKQVASKTSMEGRRHPTSPHTPDTQPNLTSPSKHKTQGQPSDTPRRMKTQHPVATNPTKQPPYDEPSPDYDDDDFNAYKLKYDEQYYRETAPDEDMHHYEQRGYEDTGAVGPYEYEYRYDKTPAYNPQLVYTTNPQGGPEYMYGEGQYMYGEGPYMYGEGPYMYGEGPYMYDSQRSSYPYPQPYPYYGPAVPQEYPEEEQLSPYDVLY